MKKLLLIVLTLALCLSAFACGGTENYTEVSEENYAETLEEFVGEEETLEIGLSKNVRVYVKMAEGANYLSTEMIYTGEGEDLNVLMELKTKEGEDPEEKTSAYVKDGFIYAEMGEAKVKLPYSETAAAMYRIGDAIDSIEQALAMIEFDPGDAEFIASLGKVEISGNAGGDRKLRLTVNESEESYTATGTIVLSFDKDNKLVGLDMNATMTADGESSTMEVKVESYTGSITFPSFNDYTLGE